MSKPKIYFIAAVVLSVLFFTLGAVTCKRTVTVEVAKPYPVTVEKPVPVHDTVYTTRNVYLPKVTTVHDTVTNTVTTTVWQYDTVKVQVPIAEKTYEETINDAKVTATVSGYEPTLERLTVENLRICPPTAPTRRFSVGVGVGYGIGMKDASHGVFSGQPFVGVTLNYNLFTF